MGHLSGVEVGEGSTAVDLGPPEGLVRVGFGLCVVLVGVGLGTGFAAVGFGLCVVLVGVGLGILSLSSLLSMGSEVGFTEKGFEVDSTSWPSSSSSSSSSSS